MHLHSHRFHISSILKNCLAYFLAYYMEYLGWYPTSWTMFNMYQLSLFCQSCSYFIYKILYIKYLLNFVSLSISERRVLKIIYVQFWMCIFPLFLSILLHIFESYAFRWMFQIGFTGLKSGFDGETLKGLLLSCNLRFLWLPGYLGLWSLLDVTITSCFCHLISYCLSDFFDSFIERSPFIISGPPEKFKVIFSSQTL